MADDNKDDSNKKENNIKFSSGFTIVLQLVPFLVVAVVDVIVVVPVVIVVAQLLSCADCLAVWASA